MNVEPTAEELKVINTLKRLAKEWPKTLWLFSASGTLWVMRSGPHETQIHLPNDGVDPNYILSSIDIPNDGGDW